MIFAYISECPLFWARHYYTRKPIDTRTQPVVYDGVYSYEDDVCSKEGDKFYQLDKDATDRPPMNLVIAEALRGSVYVTFRFPYLLLNRIPAHLVDKLLSEGAIGESFRIKSEDEGSDSEN